MQELQTLAPLTWQRAWWRTDIVGRQQLDEPG